MEVALEIRELLSHIVFEFVEALDLGETSVKIFTDSNYVKDGITKWIKNWETASGSTVKNQKLSKRFLSLEWEWVKAHNGDPNRYSGQN